MSQRRTIKRQNKANRTLAYHFLVDAKTKKAHVALVANGKQTLNRLPIVSVESLPGLIEMLQSIHASILKKKAEVEAAEKATQEATVTAETTATDQEAA